MQAAEKARTVAAVENVTNDNYDSSEDDSWELGADHDNIGDAPPEPSRGGNALLSKQWNDLIYD